jgi:hypothetical protein
LECGRHTATLAPAGRNAYGGNDDRRSDVVPGEIVVVNVDVAVMLDMSFLATERRNIVRRRGGAEQGGFLG